MSKIMQLVHVIVSPDDKASTVSSFVGTSKNGIKAEELFLEEVAKLADESLTIEEKEILLDNGFYEYNGSRVEIHWNDLEVEEEC